jgi:hypothetical protein
MELTRNTGHKSLTEVFGWLCLIPLIGLHGQGEHLPAERADDRGDQGLQALTNRTFQDRTPILGAKDEVRPDFIGGMARVCSFAHRKRILTHAEN